VEKTVEINAEDMVVTQALLVATMLQLTILLLIEQEVDEFVLLFFWLLNGFFCSCKNWFKTRFKSVN
jgi:hypothetical protein